MLSPESVVTFLRKRDYQFVKVLGQGACGQTVLLKDDLVGAEFVCKKYVPFDEAHRQSLYLNFVREIKLLHEVLHPNVVRVFNYYLYPELHAGYILMEHVSGTDIEDYLKRRPEAAVDLFLQAVEGFAYLESRAILHRDIRPLNLLVREDGVLKIIDLGFGKFVSSDSDFEKSISLNWWCELPNDFAANVYDHATEVYFVGKLFQKLLSDNGIEEFKFSPVLSLMVERDPSRRVKSFSEVKSRLTGDVEIDLEFSESERAAYAVFAQSVTKHLRRVDGGVKYQDDLVVIRARLEELHRECMLEESIPDASAVLSVLVSGAYTYIKPGFSTKALKGFIDLLRGCGLAKQRIVLANIRRRLDAVERGTKSDDDIPF